MSGRARPGVSEAGTRRRRWYWNASSRIRATASWSSGRAGRRRTPAPAAGRVVVVLMVMLLRPLEEGSSGGEAAGRGFGGRDGVVATEQVARVVVRLDLAEVCPGR